MLFPKRCPSCGAVGAAPCDRCARSLGRATSAISVAGIASCRPAFVYDERVRTLLLALKYRNRRDALAYLAGQIAAVLEVEADVVTWVPTTGARRRARGFDQAELLARAVGRGIGVPVRSLLYRVDGQAQTGRDAQARRIGPEFSVRRRRPIGASVVLIDDIGTTGATLEAAARVLAGAGWAEIHARTVAWTPRRGAGR
ncbi:MAG: phosphoribosyltransferase family protein [Acidimicrobiales bacterium]